MDEDEYTRNRIKREIKELERELKFYRNNPDLDRQFDCLDKSDFIEMRLEDLRNTLDNL